MTKTKESKQLSIEDIPANKIKELMLEHNLNDPTETAIRIAQSAFTFAQLLDDRDTIVGRELVEAFYVLECMFNFNVELIDLTKKVA